MPSCVQIAIALLAIVVFVAITEGCQYSYYKSMTGRGCSCDAGQEQCICDGYGYIDPPLQALHKLLARSCRRFCESRKRAAQ